MTQGASVLRWRIHYYLVPPSTCEEVAGVLAAVAVGAAVAVPAALPRIARAEVLRRWLVARLLLLRLAVLRVLRLVAPAHRLRRAVVANHRLLRLLVATETHSTAAATNVAAAVSLRRLGRSLGVSLLLLLRRRLAVPRLVRMVDGRLRAPADARDSRLERTIVHAAAGWCL